MNKGNKRICEAGHTYYKSSSCNTCPHCERLRKPTDDFLSCFAAPARRALEHANITSLHQLVTHTEKELLQLHGFGPSAMKIIKRMLAEQQLEFKK